jgi:hypothetical protein
MLDTYWCAALQGFDSPSKSGPKQVGGESLSKRSTPSIPDPLQGELQDMILKRTGISLPSGVDLKNGQSLNLAVTSKPFARVCPFLPAGAKHDSNRFYLVGGCYGYLYFRCYSEKCEGKSYFLGRDPGLGGGGGLAAKTTGETRGNVVSDFFFDKDNKSLIRPESAVESHNRAKKFWPEGVEVCIFLFFAFFCY